MDDQQLPRRSTRAASTVAMPPEDVHRFLAHVESALYARLNEPATRRDNTPHRFTSLRRWQPIAFGAMTVVALAIPIVAAMGGADHQRHWSGGPSVHTGHRIKIAGGSGPPLPLLPPIKPVAPVSPAKP